MNRLRHSHLPLTVLILSLITTIGMAQSRADNRDNPPKNAPPDPTASAPTTLPDREKPGNDRWDDIAPPPASRPAVGPKPRGDFLAGPPDQRGRGMGRGEGRGRGFGEERGIRSNRGMQRQRFPNFTERFIPLLEQDHPDLARRLKEIKEESPEQYERLVADALAIRFRGALDRLESGQPPEAPPPPEPGVPSPQPGGSGSSNRRNPLEPSPSQELDETVRALQQRDAELEQKTLELSERYGQITSNRQSAPEETACQELRDELKQTVAEHFEVRTELRRTELRRIERELRRLRAAIERIQADLDKRETAREIILDRRVSQLLGESENQTSSP